MTSTFPRIEFSKEDGKVIAKLAISEEGFAMWHLSKKAFISELRQKTEERRITFYQAFCLTKELLAKEDFDSDYISEDTDEDIRELFKGFADAENEFLLDFMKATGNPYSEEPTARISPSGSWTVENEPEIFFSGPNFYSRSFSNQQTGRVVIGELLKEKTITRLEAEYLETVVRDLNLPEKPQPRPDAN